MQNIPFYKMSGSGNDFILIDNREGILPEDTLTDFIRNVCRRKMSAGADGIILIEEAEGLDFQWRFYNSDGSRAEMCGNGARCAARYAHLNGIAASPMVFGTDAGPIQATVNADRVKVGMTPPSDYKRLITLNIDGHDVEMSFINTGVPHAVIRVDDIDAVPVVELGRQIREHPEFSPAGTNVNFISSPNNNRIAIRTYERGVEGETLACGTGSVAGALVHALQSGTDSPVDMITRSGSRLTIHYAIEGETCRDVYMEGDARVIYTASLTPDAWQY
ncbi:MAG: diaminopimelate epimerase [Desulfobacterales bacterium]|nr:diaminopimelate epimerase [Desulfobacterales bacterium]